MAAEEAAQWMVDQITTEADRLNSSVTEHEIEMLHRSVLTLEDDERPALVALNNKVVDLARSAMEHGKRQGERTTKARRGLVIPSLWYQKYNLAYNANNDWIVSAIMQNAMLANPMSGEQKVWKSK
jgi:hypothetical protein